jgi:hypothetical protein
MIDPRISMAGMPCNACCTSPNKLRHFNFACLHVCMFTCLVVGLLGCLEFGSRKLSRTMMQEWWVRRSEVFLGLELLVLFLEIRFV